MLPQHPLLCTYKLQCTQIHTHTNTYTHNHIHTLTHMYIYFWGHTGLMSAPSSECLSVVLKGWVND